MIVSEADFQRAVIDLARTLGHEVYHVPDSRRATCSKTVDMWENRSAPGGAGNTLRGLTRSTSTQPKEGLAMKATQCTDLIDPRAVRSAVRFCSICTTPMTKKRKETWAVWLRRATCSKQCLADVKRARYTPPAERVMARVVTDGNGCWIWTGATTPKGDYGVVGTRRGESNALTHRVMFEHANGPIPEGFQIDHLCRVTLCANPDHLEAVTQAVNLRRQQLAITHCIRGHELAGANVYVPPGTQKRICIACRHERQVAS